MLNLNFEGVFRGIGLSMSWAYLGELESSRGEGSNLQSNKVYKQWVHCIKKKLELGAWGKELFRIEQTFEYQRM